MTEKTVKVIQISKKENDNKNTNQEHKIDNHIHENKIGRKFTAKILKEIEKRQFDFNTLTLDEISFDFFIQTLMKSPNDRVIKDLHILARTLNRTELNPDYLKENYLAKEIPKKLYFCAMNIEYVFCQKESFLLMEGDIADCFFILLKGSMKVLKKTEILLLLTGEDYLNALHKVNQNGYIDMIDKTVEKNALVFNVDKKDLPYLKYINFIVIYRSLLNSDEISKDKFHNLFHKYEIQPADFFIDLDMLSGNNNEKKIDYMDKGLVKIIIHYLKGHEVDYNKYTYVQDSHYQRTVCLYDYQYLITVKSGKVIGDFSLQNKLSNRLASLRAEKDCILGKIGQDVYDEFIAEERLKEFNNEISFLITNFCFKSMPPYLFKKKYFYEFIPSEACKGTVLCKIKQNIETIYFIKEGEIELKLDISLLELRKLTLQLIEKTRYEVHGADQILKNTSIQNDYFMAEASKKRSFKICIFGSTEMIGFEAFFYNIPSFYRALVVSEKAKFFRVESRVLNTISSDEKTCYEDLKEVAKYKTNMIIKRLTEIYTVILGMVENNSNELKQILLYETPVINFKKNDAIVKNTTYISPDHYRKLTAANCKDNNESFVNKKSRNPISLSKTKSKVKSFKDLILPNLAKEMNYDIIKYQKFNKSVKKDNETDKMIFKSMEGSKKENIISTFNLLPKISLLDDTNKSKGWSTNKNFLAQPKNLKKSKSKVIKLVKNCPFFELNKSTEGVNIKGNSDSIGKNTTDNIRFHHLYVLKKKNKEEKND